MKEQVLTQCQGSASAGPIIILRLHQTQQVALEV